MAAIAHDAREAKHLDWIMRAGVRGVCDSVSAVEQAENFSGQRGEAAQVHLIVAENSDQRLGRPSAQIIKIHLRNQRGIDVIVARPFERAALAAQDVPLQILEAHRTKPQPPELARRMQQIQMHLGVKMRESRASCGSAFPAAASRNFSR